MDYTNFGHQLNEMVRTAQRQVDFIAESADIIREKVAFDARFSQRVEALAKGFIGAPVNGGPVNVARPPLQPEQPRHVINNGGPYDGARVDVPAHGHYGEGYGSIREVLERASADEDPARQSPYYQGRLNGHQ
jgi:hypothetical protein